MDQKTTYELQANRSHSPKGAVELGTERDQFVIDYIKQHASPVSQESRLRVAELSIGDGKLTKRLVNSIPRMELTCADISLGRINVVRNWVEGISLPKEVTVKFLECNFDTQFALLSDGAFDVLIALDVMEHVLDVFNFVWHCRRILRHDGILLLRVPNIAYIRHRLNLFRGHLPITASWFGSAGDLSGWRNGWGWDGGHLHLFTIPILVNLLGEYNLAVVLYRDPGTKFEFLRNLWPNLMYANPLIMARRIAP